MSALGEAFPEVTPGQTSEEQLGTSPALVASFKESVINQKQVLKEEQKTSHHFNWLCVDSSKLDQMTSGTIGIVVFFVVLDSLFMTSKQGIELMNSQF